LIYQFDFTDGFLRPLAELAGFFTLILGIMWLVYAIYETKRRGSVKERKVEEWDFDVTKFLKIFTYLGIIIGILGLLSGVGGLLLNQPPSAAWKQYSDGVSIFTSIFLIIMGILTLLKPLNDLPISSILGILLASIVVVIIAFAIPDQVYELIEVLIDPRLLFGIIFIIVFAIVMLTVKFYIGALMAISKAISWPVLAFIVAGFCILQGFLLVVLGVSITGFF